MSSSLMNDLLCAKCLLFVTSRSSYHCLTLCIKPYICEWLVG